MKLYAVLLGGSGGGGRLAEDHETVFVVAADVPSAKRQAKSKWAGHGRPHVDALEVIETVDGHEINLVPTALDRPGAFVSFNDDPHDEED
jgi:hypothetical protein